MKQRFVLAAPLLLSAALLLGTLAPGSARACACGCGVFDVGTSAMLPTSPGGMAYLEYDYMDQNKNWSGTKRAPEEDNDDKRLQTSFFTAGVRTMFDRAWAIMAEFPYWSRRFQTADDSGGIGEFPHAAVGDIRVRGVYSGFSSDMSSGLTFGVKLPSGDFTYPNYDRDTEIGTGSTDALLGAYRMGRVAGWDAWGWYANAQLDQPVLIAGGYRPGGELDAVLGSYHEGWQVGGVKIAPTAQVVGSYRGRDSGLLADSPNSGYRRVLLAPGLEFDAAGIRVYGDVGFPVYQDVNGNQLAASEFFKLNIGFAF